jgi:hypothetical protein
LTPWNYVTVVATMLLAGQAALAADEAGTIKVSKGQVSVQRDTQQLPATVGTRIFSNDRVVTGADGSVGITLRDNTLLSAGPNSTIDATVRRGTLSVISGKIAKATPEGVRFSAPGLTLGVRGTSFVIDAGQ